MVINFLLMMPTPNITVPLRLIEVLEAMSVGPLFMKLTRPLKLNVDIMSDSSALLLVPSLHNWEAVLCDFFWYEAAHIE